MLIAQLRRLNKQIKQVDREIRKLEIVTTGGKDDDGYNKKRKIPFKKVYPTNDMGEIFRRDREWELNERKRQKKRDRKEKERVEAARKKVKERVKEIVLKMKKLKKTYNCFKLRREYFWFKKQMDSSSPFYSMKQLHKIGLRFGDDPKPIEFSLLDDDEIPPVHPLIKHFAFGSLDETWVENFGHMVSKLRTLIETDIKNHGFGVFGDMFISGKTRMFAEKIARHIYKAADDKKSKDLNLQISDELQRRARIGRFNQRRMLGTFAPRKPRRMRPINFPQFRPRPGGFYTLPSAITKDD